MLEEGGSVVCIVFNLSKAFDLFPHYLTIDSLARVDVCEALYDWFGDHLSGRSQCVTSDGVTSPPAVVSSLFHRALSKPPLIFCLAVDPLARLSIGIQYGSYQDVCG